MLDFIVKRGRFDVIQVTYSFAIGTGTDGPAIEAALDELKKAGVGAVAMKVMGGGYVRRLADSLRRFLLQRPSAYVAALRWAMRYDRVQTSSVRMADREQLEENIRAMERPFSEEDRKLLAAHLERIGPLLCRMCGACDGGCPKGLPVSDLVRSVTYAEGYGVYAMGRERFDRLPPVVRQVRCAGCRSCAVRCPNGVRVRERLLRAQELYC
jgi:predicted aldo/keto reductase-like oxidoreductase